MKHLVAITGLAGLLTLGGCASIPGGPPTIPILPAVGPLINLLPIGWQDEARAIQAAIVDKCQWKEPLENIASIAATFAGLGGVAAIGNAVLNAVCQSVSAKGVRYGAKTPRAVRGVVLRGGFVR